MIRIQVRPQLRSLALAGVALGAFANVGCAADTDTSAELEQALITAPGTGVIRVNGYALAYSSTSGGDEFIRVGERMTAQLSFDELRYTFPSPERDSLTPENVTVVTRLTWRDAAGATNGTAEVPVRWGGANRKTGTSSNFVIPANAASFVIDFFVTAPSGSFLASERFRVNNVFPIFGFDRNAKTALFDNSASYRIVEGGNLVTGGSALVSMVDWRADAIVDRWRLDTYYGKTRQGSRFGTVIVDARAPVEYEIGVAYTVDGRTWTGTSLLAAPNAPVLQTQSDTRRTAYQGLIGLPQAGELRMAFNVRAFLVVPNYGSEVFDARYRPGQRVELANRWDNAGGADYRLPISAR